ncbi:MAG: acylphosphatase [Beijerinckiaceae bacterium]|nr:acylphosphatase [Beijerinckiaceae bacterium]
MTAKHRIVRVTIGGRVQGVGFRAWTQMEASSRGISGWVRNRVNGDVEALFAGPPDAVEELCEACWQGPLHARVRNVDVVEEGPAALAEMGANPGFHLIATR